MKIEHLMWICGGLFIVFGLIGAVNDDPAWQRPWLGLSTLSLGCFGLAMASDGLRKGEIRFQFTPIRRADKPRTFWAAIALVFTAGVGVVIAAIWAIFFK